MNSFKSYFFLAVLTLQIFTAKEAVQSGTPAHAAAVQQFESASISSRSGGESSPISLSESSLPALNLPQELQPTTAWVRQFSSRMTERAAEKAVSVAVDGQGNIIIAGSTGGSLFASSLGGMDAFVAKFDAGGNRVWANQFGSVGTDTAVSIAVDKSSNIYVAGSATHFFGTMTTTEEKALFIRKYDFTGNQLWTVHFGFDPLDEVSSIALDSLENLYVAGSRFIRRNGQGPDYRLGFFSKYDSTGKELLDRVFSFPDSSLAKSVAVNGAGEIYLGGQNIKLDSYPFGNIDALLKKYSTAGYEIWSRTFGAATSEDGISSVMVDSSGNVYAAGFAPSDAFLRKYDSNGNELWTRQFGAFGGAGASSVASDSSGSVYLAGFINTNPHDLVRTEGEDAFIRKYDSSGNELWAYRFGTSSKDVAYAIAVDRSGSIYAAGATDGAFPGEQYPNNTDAFLLKVIQPAPPAPSPPPAPAPSPAPAPEPLPAPEPETPPAPEEPLPDSEPVEE